MKKIYTISIILVLFAAVNFAQDSTAAKVGEVKDALTGLNESYLETKATVDALKKIKISGYIQSQFQSIESDGAATFAGGNFAAGMHNRFMVRRGRVKFNYDNDLTQFVVQVDITEKGFATKDAYVSFIEPWMKTFGLTAGIFDRPFGFEISYSSSNRESPERSRLFQTLFPGERDLGFKLEVRPQEGPLSYFNLKAGLFAGNGVNPETDNNKDFIGRLGFSFPFVDENLAIDGGISAYMGKVIVPAGKSLITVNSPTLATTTIPSDDADRSYLGADLQLYYELPLLGRFTLRGEYISGKQAGSSSSNASYTAAPSGDIYLRNFMGYYLMWVQNLGEKNQFVLKYDVYDPNSDVAGDDIGANAAAKLGAPDIKYSTLGIGLVHYWDDNVKLVFYYDSVSNETSSKLAAFNSDLKDNVFTFRIQYKF
ncbi:MAG: porin [Ignavibacteriales bacterium]|nr:MAG: porin [Ignavibacteriales bacterium]